ncbi:MAG: D-lactate dehydrogenase [candidate division WS6 bacterium OLB20]|uniref:D-lactate dehydrogenase n=1 Tax=candidate division WS6 bacterium OLB20 TaxID=1617426 RepID=A0A136M015_9BACT|nr:MAG: D-lactate dehydrogenase [candidate division WS6 bacterium OLB20]
MKTALFEVPADEEDLFRSELGDCIISRDPLSEHNLPPDDTEIVCVFVGSELNEPVLADLPALKAIVTRSTGYDHIDIDYCAAHGITVSNVPHYGEKTVAEHTFALLLALSRNIHRSHVRALKDDFDASDLQGFELAGKVLGVVGTGSIGSHVIRIAHGFSMKVLAWSRTKRHELVNAYGVEYVDTFGELLRRSDIVTLHVPHSAETHHLLNTDTIHEMRPGAYLINTSRGELVDTDALYKALKNGHLGGAGLDVIEGEELISEDFELLYEHSNPDVIRQIYRDRTIFRMENVVFTPHSGFNSKEARMRLLRESVANIKAVRSGTVLNPVG